MHEEGNAASSDRLFTADVVKRAQRLLIGVQRLATST
jgi:hypothetical protein